MTRFPFLTAVTLLAGTLLLAGCRTYGDAGYQSEEKIYDAIQQTILQIEQDLDRSQSALRRLESAADSIEALRPLADRYLGIVQSHEDLLAVHLAQAKHLSGDSYYRNLHRVYGAMITDRRLLQRQYDWTTRKVWATVRDTTMPRVPLQLESSYMITPVQFPRVERTGRITMAEALQAAEGTPGLQMEEETGGAE